MMTEKVIIKLLKLVLRKSIEINFNKFN
jgi:hypothetical protein